MHAILTRTAKPVCVEFNDVISPIKKISNLNPGYSLAVYVREHKLRVSTLKTPDKTPANIGLVYGRCTLIFARTDTRTAEYFALTGDIVDQFVMVDDELLRGLRTDSPHFVVDVVEPARQTRKLSFSFW